MIWAAHRTQVERAVRRVRRELFLPADQRPFAAKDAALPIGHEQTISQPSLVARMTEELAPSKQSRILEIGTGSGYQTAILAEIAGEVFTIERVPELGISARERLVGLGYRNIRFRIGDGALGWPEEAPFDEIMVTAAPRHLPPALVEQLKPGGRMVAPVGATEEDSQVLLLIEKNLKGEVTQREICQVRFVPLVSDATDSS